MKDQSRRKFIQQGGALGAVAMVGPGLMSVANAAGKPTLVLYNGQHRSTTKKLIEAFTQATGIEVKRRDGNSARLANQIIEEGKRSPADLIYTEDSAPIAALEERGLLKKLHDKTFDHMRTQYSSSEHNWVGLTARSRVTVFNPNMVKESELPESVLDMATKEWQGRVAFVPTSGAFQQQIIAIKIMHGRDAALNWLKGLKKYGEIYSGNMAAMRAVEAGEIATGLINNYYWFIVAREKGPENMVSKLHFSTNGDVGGLLSVSASGILKSSKQPKIAQQFVDFMTSVKGQETITAAVAEYPLRKGVKSPFAGEPYNMTPFDELEPPQISPQQMGDAEDALKLRREAGLA